MLRLENHGKCISFFILQLFKKLKKQKQIHESVQTQ